MFYLAIISPPLNRRKVPELFNLIALYRNFIVPRFGARVRTEVYAGRAPERARVPMSIRRVCRARALLRVPPGGDVPHSTESSENQETDRARHHQERQGQRHLRSGIGKTGQ